ncbi:MAG: ABC transporter permease [Bacteroidales bacterium]|nr:ABC transporter permease [Bacteroidales bacterium]
MRKIQLIVRREYCGMVRRPSFVISSLLFPVILIVAFGFMPAMGDVANLEQTFAGMTEAESAMLFGSLLSTMTFLFVMSNSIQIMNSVVEEKSSRIVEVLVSAVSPIELLAGKIIGVALAGMTQIAIFVVLFALGAMFLPIGFVEVLAAVPISFRYATIFAIFVLYFIGGYLLYASICASFGSAVDQASDAGQYVAPLNLLLIASLWIGLFSLQAPDGNLALLCSMIPFTSPVVAMARVTAGMPLYQLIVSLLILYASAIAMSCLSARIYRTGILMYGRKFSLSEILRWARLR